MACPCRCPPPIHPANTARDHGRGQLVPLPQLPRRHPIRRFVSLCWVGPTLQNNTYAVHGYCTCFETLILGWREYKLSALSAQLQRDGKSFTICARIQLVLLLILSFKDNSAFQGFYRFLVELIWSLNIYMYFSMAYDGAVGVKHGRLYWLAIYRLLRTKGGLTKVVRNTILDMFGAIGGNEPVSVKRKVPVGRRK